MVRLECYWMKNKDWTHIEDGRRVINDDAPEEAKASYENYLTQLADIDRRTKRTLVIPKNQAGIDDYEYNDADWFCGSYETDVLKVFNIPYDEFCQIREKVPIEDYLAEGSWRLYETETKRYLSLLQEQSLQVPKLISVLTEALEYHTFVEYVEEHIL